MSNFICTLFGKKQKLPFVANMKISSYMYLHQINISFDFFD